VKKDEGKTIAINLSAIVIIMCNEPIVKKLNVLKATNTYGTMASEDQFAEILNWIRTKYSPVVENTVIERKQILETMNPNIHEGLRKVVSTFTTCVSQMELKHSG
jgi:hypothetical protein